MVQPTLGEAHALLVWQWLSPRLAGSLCRILKGTPYWETPELGGYSSVNCANTFDSDGILLIKARELQEPLEEPRSVQNLPFAAFARVFVSSIFFKSIRKHFFWGAQFSFSSADVLCEVPYDPQLKMLFFGEEILMAVRYFTHGWVRS